MRRYCHVGTGNYNPKTARLYEDLGLLTCDPDIGADLTQLFNFLTGYGRDVAVPEAARRPALLRPRITELTRRSEASHGRAGQRSHRMKMNSLVDPEMIDALYAASQAGVHDRPASSGASAACVPACRACPTTSGCARSSAATSSTPASTTSRNGAGRGRAALLHRLGRPDAPQPRPPRRGAGARRTTRPCRTSCDEILDVDLADDMLAWTLGPDGTWTKVPTAADGTGVDTHVKLQELAATRGRWSGN